MPISKEEILANDGDPEILDRLDIRNKHGIILAKFGLGLELFVAPRERRTLREQMLAAEQLYYRRFKEWLTHLLLPEQRRAPRIKGDPIELFRKTLENTPMNLAFSTRLFSDPTPPNVRTDPPPYLVDFLVVSDDKDKLSFINGNLPVSNPTGGYHFDSLRELLLDWCNLLKPAHGVAGFSLHFEPGLEQNARHAYATMKRHPGLEFIDSSSFLLEVGPVFNRIKGINWLTVLSNEVLSELGGIATARTALEPDCTLHEYEGGVVIQAGPMPQLGDTHLGLIPQRYRKAAHFTRAVRFDNYQDSLFRVFPPLDGPTEANSWVRRFD